MANTKTPVVLPPNRAWTQPNTGYLFGSLYSTRNINLEIPGVLSLSKRGRYLGRADASGSTFDYLLSIVYDGQALTGSERYYLISSDRIYTLNQTLGSFGIDGTASTPSMSLGSSDGIMWNDGLYVTTSAQIASLIAGTWTTSGIGALTTTVPHPLCIGAISGSLFIGNGNLLKKLTTAPAYTTALTLPPQYRIQWIRSDNTRVLIGTRNMNGGNATVFEWDEVAATWTNRYDIEGVNWVYSGEFRNTDFFIVCNDGRLMKFNGAGFSEAARFPVYKTLPGNWLNAFTLGTVFQRGMRIVDGRVNLLINGEVGDAPENTTFYENMLSGIWEFDESTGLNHKFGLSFSQTAEDYCQGEIAGGAGALGFLYVDPVTGGPDIADGTTLLYGARLSAGSVDYYTVGTVVSGVNRGEFETTRIETTGIADDTLKLWVKFRGVWTSSDKIIFKYKDTIRDGIPFNVPEGVTWTSTTVFTSTNVRWADALVGDEVTVIERNGAGAAAHISSISLNTGTYTVTLDEAIPNVSNGEVAGVICDNYTRLETQITNTANEIVTDKFAEIAIPQANPSTWVQVKGELRGYDTVTIEELQIINGTHVIATS